MRVLRPVTLTAYSGTTVVGSVASAFNANTFFSGNQGTATLRLTGVAALVARRRLARS